MAKRPDIKVIPGDDAKSSFYRFHGSRKKLTFGETVAKLMGEFSIEFDAAPQLVEEFYAEAMDSLEGEGPEYVVPILSRDIVELFYCFRWFSSEDGTSAVYVCTSPDHETYVLTSDPMTTASAIVWRTAPDGTPVTLEDVMAENYFKLAKQGRLSFIKDEAKTEDGEVTKQARKVILPTLAEYWEDSVQKAWRRDSRFRLPTRPCEIASDPSVPTFFYWDSSRVKPGPHPNWDRWMEAIPDYAKSTFRAWIASVLDPQNKGRQALWMQDQGYSGKSTVIRVLSKFLGTHAVGAISHGALGNQFGYASIYGKRLVVYGDNKNPKLLHMEKVHSLLGGDIVQIERKNVQPFSAPIHAKLWIAANCTPEIDLGSRSETTRVIPIFMQEPPESVLKSYCKVVNGRVARHKDGSPIFIGGNLEELLTPEVPAFLHTCQQDYEELCPTRMDISLSEEMWEALQVRCPSPEHMSVERFIEEELEIGEDFVEAPGLLQEEFSKWTKGKSNQYDFSRLRTFLQTQHGCKDATRKGKRVITGIRLKAVGRPRELKV